MLSVDEAQETILGAVRRTPVEWVSLPQSLGRTLAEEMRASLDHPPWDASAMDGYAVRASDVRAASRESPCRLAILETLLAGRMPQHAIGPNQAAKIMTGAPIPSGADAVVWLEGTQQRGDVVDVFEPVEVGEDIRRRGEALRVGDEVLSPGVRVRPAEVGIMASLGRTTVAVYQRPSVAILVTGDELAQPGESRAAGQIYNSNGPALAAQVMEAGGMPICLGIARDAPDDLRAKINAARRADLIVVSGGVSVGEADFVKAVLSDLGVQLAFWRVAMKPGHPLAFGTWEGRLVFGLPGNPVSVMVAFEQFVRPALLSALGRREVFRPTRHATLDEAIYKRAGRRHFVRATLSVRDGACHVRPTGDQGSGTLLSMVRADALIVLPEGREQFHVGETVQVQLF